MASLKDYDQIKKKKKKKNGYNSNIHTILLPCTRLFLKFTNPCIRERD